MNKSISDLAAFYALTHSDVAQAFLDGYNAAMQAKPKSRKKDLDLSFIQPSFLAVIEKWLSYKKERKSPYTQRGAESLYKKLLSMSGGNPAIADAIVEQSIANNWQGLFELKSNGTLQPAKSTLHSNPQSVAGRRESVERLAGLSEAVLRGIGGNNPQGYDSCGYSHGGLHQNPAWN